MLQIIELNVDTTSCAVVQLCVYVKGSWTHELYQFLLEQVLSLDLGHLYMALVVQIRTSCSGSDSLLYIH